MILTVTINPLLEHRFTFKNIIPNHPKRNGKLHLVSGGKGINVSRQLNNLKLRNMSLTFAGGAYGKLFRESVSAEGLNVSFIRTKSETRICSVIINSDDRKATYYFGENSKITIDETGKFITKMEKMIQNCEVVIFSGSSPCREAEIIFPTGIELANKYNKISVCDTYGNHLENCLAASPQIIHNNEEEIANSLNIKLNTESDVIELLTHLYKKGTKQVYLTNGEKNYYASNFDFHYKVSVPKIETIDPTGSGDAIVAGIAFGWHKNMKFENQTKFATALGVVNATMFDVCNVSLDEANNIVESVICEPIGKKMKIINDTPD